MMNVFLFGIALRRGSPVETSAVRQKRCLSRQARLRIIDPRDIIRLRRAIERPQQIPLYRYRNQTVISASPRLAKAKYGMNFAFAGTEETGFASL